MTAVSAHSSRLEGLDIARYLAFAGMVLVNFRLAMQVRLPPSGWLSSLYAALEGKASATFVVLAGISLALATRGMSGAVARKWIARRALFLLALGSLNTVMFAADILHFYAVYFLLAIPLLKRGIATIGAVALGVAATSLWAQLCFDYSQGWNWEKLEYMDLWTVRGALRNLLFNGFHPILPWFSFLLFGLMLGRCPIHRSHVHMILIAGGLTALVCGKCLFYLFQSSQYAWLLDTSPIPPGPNYLITGLGAASTLIGTCLLVQRYFSLGWLVHAGRLTLTLYFAHILLGMGTLEALDMLDGKNSLFSVTALACLFLVVSTVFVVMWKRLFTHGPMEALMRLVSGPPHQQTQQRSATQPHGEEVK